MASQPSRCPVDSAPSSTSLEDNSKQLGRSANGKGSMNSHDSDQQLHAIQEALEAPHGAPAAAGPLQAMGTAHRKPNPGTS